MNGSIDAQTALQAAVIIYAVRQFALGRPIGCMALGVVLVSPAAYVVTHQPPTAQTSLFGWALFIVVMLGPIVVVFGSMLKWLWAQWKRLA